MILYNNMLGKDFKYYAYKDMFNAITKEAFKILKIKKDREISLSFTDKEFIKDINKQYRNKDSVTDVISFAFDESGIQTLMLGDILICIDRAKEQAKEYGHSFKRELAFLYCHGLLHLLGFDHITKEQEEEMFKLQDVILNNLNIRR